MRLFWGIFWFLSLTVSAACHAQGLRSVSLPVDSVSFQEGSWMIELEGPRATPCLSLPRVQLSNSQTEPNSILLRVVAERTADICAQVVSGRYRVLVDLKETLGALAEDLEPGVVYNLRAEKGSFEMSFLSDDVLKPQPLGIPITSVGGTLMRSSNGRLAIWTANQQMIPVHMAVDPTPYLNKMVFALVRPKTMTSRVSAMISIPVVGRVNDSRDFVVFSIGTASL